MDTDLTLHVAAQCAPVLLGIKMSNILITHPDNRDNVFELFQGTKFSVSQLVKNQERIIFLVYRRQRQCSRATTEPERGYVSWCIRVYSWDGRRI